MAQATANFELGVQGSAVLVADPGSATAWDIRDNPGGNAITYDNAHAYGLLAAKVDNTANAASQNQLIWTTGIGTLTDWYGRLYLYATTFPTTGSYRLVQDSNNNFPVFINATGEVQQYDQGGFVHQTTAVIGLNQWVRIEWHWLNSATVGQVEVKLFNSPDSATPTETKTSAANRNTSVSTTEIRFGLGGGTTEAGPVWLDNLVAGATSYPGPVVVPSTAPQVLSMQSHVFGHGVW